jgi:hypothetical protein
MPSVGSGSGAGDVRYLVQSGHGGKFQIQGLVVDDKGEPVEGAAVLIDKDLVYTTSAGTFSIREKKKEASVMVNPDNFICSGDYEVSSAPGTIRAGEPGKIVLHRK